VTGFSSHPTEAPDIAGIYSLAGSGIDSPEDLEGHSVAVNTLGVQAEFTIREVVAQHGGDPDQVNFVELGFPDMLAALDSGSVDAVWEVEPFVTMAEDAGYHLVSYNYLETIAGAPSNVIIASENGAAQDSDLMDRMTAAIDEATEFAQENPDQVREVLTTTLELDDDLAQRIAMEQFGRCPSREALESIAALAMDNNALSEEPDVDAFIPEGC
jgi:NitT/TauT family transport system substrate-binding protein